MKPTIYFAHGKESGPWGTKIQALSSIAQAQGFGVESPDYTALRDPDARARHLLALTARHEGPIVLVGSSMGGYVALIASAQLQPCGVFLMAPAVYLEGYAEQDPVSHADKTVVVHGWHDTVVPVENAIRFARKHEIDLHLLNSDHSLINSIDYLCELFAIFLKRLSKTE